MPVSAIISGRPIAAQDIAFTANPSGETFSATVLGLGATALNKVPAVLYTSFQQYFNDSVAAVAGVLHGELYYNTAASKLHARTLPVRETPVGQADGSNLSYTFSAAAVFLEFFQSRQLLIPGTDYILSGSVATILPTNGTVAVAGANVVKLAGADFKKHWSGMSIVINSTSYIIDRVVSPSFLVVVSSVGTFPSTSYAVAGAPAVGETIEGIYWV